MGDLRVQETTGRGAGSATTTGDGPVESGAETGETTETGTAIEIAAMAHGGTALVDETPVGAATDGETTTGVDDHLHHETST